jgi:hypothetical protein
MPTALDYVEMNESERGVGAKDHIPALGEANRGSQPDCG